MSHDYSVEGLIYVGPSAIALVSLRQGFIFLFENCTHAVSMPLSSVHEYNHVVFSLFLL